MLEDGKLFLLSADGKCFRVIGYMVSAPTINCDIIDLKQQTIQK